MDIMEEVHKIKEYIINLRRFFHQNPELSGEEENTINHIKLELERLEIDYIEVANGGILGFINKEKGKKVLLRADVDALPVKETTKNLLQKRACISKNKGVMHACGHDGHIAMLLGTAKILQENREKINGQIILCFERGEEVTENYEYIHAYMDKNNIVPDTCFALHLKSDIDTGVIGIRDDAMMSASIFFECQVHGKGGHGSRPDEAVNPIEAFIGAYNYIKGMRMNLISPFETLTISIGELQAGKALNVIPEYLTFGGTVRFLNREKVGIPIYHALREELPKIAKIHGCRLKFNELKAPSHPVTNDNIVARFAREKIAQKIGKEKVIIPEAWMASETFCNYLLQWPGVFAFLGIKNDEKGTGAIHHNEYFDIDEDALVNGVVASITFATEFFNTSLELKKPEFHGRFKDLLEEKGKTQEKIEKIYNLV